MPNLMAQSQPLHEYLDVPYTPTGAPFDPLRSLDVYDVSTPTTPSLGSSRGVIVFVHGGAWRSEDKADHAGLARHLARATGYPVAVPNYRLTTSSTMDIQWPTHSVDILDALTFIRSWGGPSYPTDAHRIYDPSRIFLIGHSAGAHILATIFLSREPAVPPLTPRTDLLAAIKGIIGSEGLYDIDLLLRSFPTYREWFIEAALGPPDDEDGYKMVSPASPAFSLRAGGERIRWLILHSPGDSLVDELQSRAMYDRLRALHDARSLAPRLHVHKDFERLTEDHHAVVRSEVFVTLISQFIESFSA